MRNVVVIGVGQTLFGKLPDRSAYSLGTEAVWAAIEDAGIRPKEIQVAYGSRVYDALTTVEDILKNVGVTAIEMYNVENGCASGMAAANLLWRDIASGAHDIGIVVGTEQMTNSSIAGKQLSKDEDVDSLLGLGMPGYFALLAKRFMISTGLTMEELVYPSVKNHRNGVLNPYAMFKKPCTTQEVLESRMISDPITLLQCCPTTDGAAAAIYCSEEYAKRLLTKPKPIYVAASKLNTGTWEDPTDDFTGFAAPRKLAKSIYEEAGVGPEDLDCVELHDAFSPEELWAYCDLGLTKPENLAQFIEERRADINGTCAVNASGGLMSAGHPVAASGVRVICEVVHQLRGDAGEHQVEGAKLGLAQMLGGYISGIQVPVVGMQLLKS